MKTIATIVLLIVAAHLAATCPPNSPIKTDYLFVLFDAGETNMQKPVFEKWTKENKDFLILAMGTAATLVKTGEFENRVITLSDLEVSDQIDNTTERTQALSKHALSQLSRIKPKTVLVGVASEAQYQCLQLFSDSITIAVIDNFDYDPTSTIFETVNKVQEAAQHVFCPSQNIADLFSKGDSVQTRSYHVVGKPSLDSFSEDISNAKENLSTIYSKAFGSQFIPDKPIITIFNGYGEAYDKVLYTAFQALTKELQLAGFYVYMQNHPKICPQQIKTTEALAMSDFVIVYNSSVGLEAAIAGKKTVFFIPEEAPFSHLATTLLPTARNSKELLNHLKNKNNPPNIRKLLNIPPNSTLLFSLLAGRG